MRTFPLIHFINPADDDAVIHVASMVPESESDAFVAEVADHLGSLLGVPRRSARCLFAVDLRGSTSCPVPACFELAPTMRATYAREVAAVVRAALGAASAVAA